MRPKIYLFGDSITEESFSDGGWGASLAHHFCRTADVVLRGYSGYNTRWALMMKEKFFPPPGSGHDPAAVTVFFGANDAALADRYSGFQHVPPDEYKQNLLDIVAFLKKQWPSICIILITPPPIDEAARLLHPFTDNPSGLPERTNEAAGIYAKQCLAAAAECGLPSINLWEKMQQFSGWGKAYLSDGLHLNRNGNKFVFEEVVKRLKEERISLEALPADLPLISLIDPNQPLKAFESFLGVSNETQDLSFGDSITEESFRDGGWGSSLADHFCRTADVVLRGYNGYNTRWALMVKEKSFPPPGSGNDPAVVTVFFGANDAALPDRCRGFLHVPPDEYKQNLLGIVAFLKKQWPSTCIILITPPPIDEAASLLHPYMDNASDLPDRTNEAAGIYAKQCLAAAAECGLPSINLWEKMQQFSGWGKAYLSDGVHLNRNGNKFLFEEVVKELKEAKISLEALPADLLLISMIDPNHPLKAFESFL